MSCSLLPEIQIPESSQFRDINSNLTPQYTWNERFRCEEERLKTFENWPLEWLSKQTLASSGMFYMGINDHTKCYFCEVIIGKWDHNDDPVSEHLRWSPNCPLLRRRTTDNMPLNEKNLDHILPAVEPGCYDTPPSTSWKSRPVSDYSIKEVRLHSFAEWPRSMRQKPEQLAEAGFYYKGCGDSVVCFSCLAGLKDWEEDDDPWEQHALWMGHFCPYVKLIKGEEYIKAVCTKFPNYQNEKLEEKCHTNQNLLLPESDDLKICKICLDKEYNTVYVPCGHVVSCASCALSVKECPVCRATIKNVVRLYFS